MNDSSWFSKANEETKNRKNEIANKNANYNQTMPAEIIKEKRPVIYALNEQESSVV